MKKMFFLIWVLAAYSMCIQAQNTISFDRYHTPKEINNYLKQSEKDKNARLHLIGHSATGIPINVLEIGSETAQMKKTKPAVFVAANFEGTHPLGTEGASYLIKELMQNPEQYTDLTWYILPMGNPEALQRYFDEVKEFNARNKRPINDDLDDQTDEDPPEDLNGDGWITQMRVKDPDGSYIKDTSDARRMKRADASKGEKGIYKVYTEGVDNDKDGRYNEDGLGGTNTGISFPHLFKATDRQSGRWPGEEEEVFGVMKFFTDHPNIALVMVYGHSSFCFTPPKAGRKGSVNMNSLKIPRRYAGMLGADPNKTYSMAAVKEMMKAIVPPGTPIDDSMVAGMLGLGAVVNPLAKDMKFYTAYAKEYKKYLKENDLSVDRLNPVPAKDGSMELWAYYHVGLPVFTQDFWGVPVFKPAVDSTKEKAKKAPAGSKAKKPDAEKTFLSYSDSLLAGKGFVNWATYQHPDLGEVEIGGRVPYADKLPPANEIGKLLKAQVPWVFRLAKDIPVLTIEKHRVKDLGDGIYQVEVWIRNTGKLPFPTAMGTRNGNPPPAVVSLDGEHEEIIQGRLHTPLLGLDAGHQRKFKWLMKTKRKVVDVKVVPVNAKGSTYSIQLGGQK